MKFPHSSPHTAPWRFLQVFQSKKENGFTLPQLITTIAVVGVLSAIAVPSISFGVNPLGDTSNRVKNQIKLARNKAMATTTAYRLKPLANNQVEIQRHSPQPGYSMSSCSDAAIETDGGGNPLWERLPGYNSEDFTFEDGVQLTGVSVNGTTVSDVTDWQLCFNSRGLSNQSVELEFTEVNTGETIDLLIFMGGSVNMSAS